MSQEARWWTEVIIQVVAAIATIAAVLVALRLASRSEKSPVQVHVIEVGWDPATPPGLRFDFLVTNTGERPVLLSSLGLRTAGRFKFLRLISTHSNISFGSTEIFSVPSSDFENAMADLASRSPRWWRVRRLFPRPSWFTCSLVTGEEISVPLLARTLLRIRGRQPAADHWMSSSTRYP